MRKRRANVEPTEEPDAPQESTQTLLQQIQAMPTDQWRGKRVYVYRVFPIIDKKGDDHFIAKLGEGFDEDYLCRTWGSGRYHLRLNNAQGHTLATQNVAIHNPAFPPKVDPLEVVQSDPRNKVYFDVWGPRSTKPEPASADSAAVGELAKLAGKVLEQKTGGPAQNNGLSEATTTLLLGMSKGRDELAEKLASHQPSATPDPIAAVDRLADLIKKIQPDNGKHVDPVTALREAVELIRAVQPTAAAPADPIAQFKGVLEMLKQAKELVGVPENDGVVNSYVRSRLGSWQEFTVAIAPHLSQILGPFSTLFAHVLSQKMLNGAPPQAFGVNSPPSPLNPTATQPPGQQAGGQQSEGPLMMPFLQMIAHPMMNYARLMAQNIEPAELGGDFASWVHEGFAANPNYDQAIIAARAMGPLGIIAAFRSTPLWADKGPQENLPSLAELEPTLPAFFSAFLNWTPPEADDEMGERYDTEEPPVVSTYSEAGP